MPCVNYIRDEGGPLGVGLQDQAPNRLELHRLRVDVVSVEGNVAARLRQVRIGKTNKIEPSMRCRELIGWRRNRDGRLARDRVQWKPVYRLDGARHKGGVSPIQALVWNVRTCRSDVKGRTQAEGLRESASTDAEQRVGNNLYKIWNRLCSGAYFPPPVLRVEIPKRDGGLRKLGIPTVGDRVAQTVIKMYLEPIVERTFHPDSYGYRPGRSAHQAVEQARRRCWHHDWVLDLDIRSFFDSIDHALMMRAVKRFTNCRWVLLYVERWLKADVQLACGRVEKRSQGTPQGGVASPVLANMFLHLAFDQWMAETFADVPFERYAADVVVHCRSTVQAEFMRDQIERRLHQCGLELHPQKTLVVCCRPSIRSSAVKSFDFLGFTFQPRVAKNKEGRLFTTFGPAISRSAANDVRRTIRRLWRLPRRTGMEISEIASIANPMLWGWINYYGRFRPSALVGVFRSINLSLRLWVMRKYKRFKRRPGAAMQWLVNISQRERGLFAALEVSESPFHIGGWTIGAV